MRATADRVTGYLSELSRRFPSIWTQVEDLRSHRDTELPTWPDWCYLPLAGACVIAARGREALESEVAVIGALSTWRATQGIYRIDRDVFRAVWDTPVKTLPVEVFYQLPEWCLYVELPAPLHCGFFAHLEWDAQNGRTELRLLFDNAGELLPVMLPLTRSTVSGCMTKALTEAGRRDWVQRPAGAVTEPTARSVRPEVRWLIERCIGLLLYICAASANRDITDEDGSQRQPIRSEAKKKGEEISSSSPLQPTNWTVGWRMGAALRAARRAYRQTADLAGPAEHASRRPHIRKAHFHHYWTVSKSGNRRLVLRWLPPMGVKSGLGQIVPAVRRVQ